MRARDPDTEAWIERARRAEAITLDATNPAACERLASETVARFGRAVVLFPEADALAAPTSTPTGTTTSPSNTPSGTATSKPTSSPSTSVDPGTAVDLGAAC